jgi:hypothetical protein
LNDVRWLLPYGKAYVNSEKRGIHSEWWKASEHILKAEGCLDGRDMNQKGIGVTPAVLHRDTMNSLYARMIRLLSGPKYSMNEFLRNTVWARWKDANWTEYTCYRVMGCLRGDFFSHHSYEKQLNNTPNLYHGIWNEKQFNSILDNPAKEKILFKSLFIVLQDDAVKHESPEVSRFYRDMFCPLKIRDPIILEKFGQHMSCD